jgi:hypothetical protein
VKREGLRDCELLVISRVFLCLNRRREQVRWDWIRNITLGSIDCELMIKTKHLGLAQLLIVLFLLL